MSYVFPRSSPPHTQGTTSTWVWTTTASSLATVARDSRPPASGWPWKRSTKWSEGDIFLCISNAHCVSKMHVLRVFPDLPSQGSPARGQAEGPDGGGRDHAEKGQLHRLPRLHLQHGFLRRQGHHQVPRAAQDGEKGRWEIEKVTWYLCY